MRLALPLLAVFLASPATAAETMRIAVGGEVPGVVVTGDALLVGPDEEDAALSPHPSPTATVTQAGGVLAVDGRAVSLPAVRFRAPDGILAVNGVRLRGDVVVVRAGSRLQPVNVIALEDYLVGVLGSEMPVSFPPEALRAQAVAARTYALSRKLEQYGQPFHLGSSVLSQVYSGLKAEDPRARQAVDSTRGMVLTFMLQPIEAYFHASCGGRTESGRDALGRDLPYLRPVDCPCGSLDHTHWKVTLSRAELRKVGLSPGTGVRVQGRSSTGRARELALGARRVDAVTFRQKLGYARVKSLSFQVDRQRDGWVVEGLGFGHGAGMCQWGAKLYAEKGWDFARILGHYYPGTELHTLYE